MLEKIYQSHSESDNPAIAEKILRTCNNVRVFAFYGELGAGKTHLVKAFCQALGMEVSVSSPTFSLVHEYQDAGVLVYHMDLYRLKTEEEALEIGCEEYFYSGAYVFI
ncbi:MAG: tRNA (adenosine(37)-N6)-threonylcarbamoyltransferase complex ATPase subunit type 1 TsaE, partial [Bacteroidota bacterium]